MYRGVARDKDVFTKEIGPLLLEAGERCGPVNFAAARIAADLEAKAPLR